MDRTDLDALVRALREDGGDSFGVEAKAAREGLPSGLEQVLSGFANRPGGGVLLLGLDERNSFEACGVYDASKALQAVASVARQALLPPVTIVTSTESYEGAKLAVVEVQELASTLKPCRVSATGKAYLRAHDGTYEMSELEAQALAANRDRPRFDEQPVPGASRERDLDPELVATYLQTCRSSSSSLARFGDHELLVRTGVLTSEGDPTLAGVLSLGLYPQQFRPNFVIRARVTPRPGDPPGTRASDIRSFDGPLPTILDEVTQWVQRNTRTRVRFAGGHGLDEPEYPAEAVRELVGNALVHRDLGPHAASYPISLVLEHHRLVISNPGGLWGITVDRLGRSGISSARNEVLLRIAQNTRTRSGRRVVEGLATGIETVLTSLAEAGMVPPEFIDQGIRFTVRVPNHALLGRDDLEWLSRVSAGGFSLSDTQRHALVAMRHGTAWTNRSFREHFPRDSVQARRDLQGLVDAGLAIAEGERGARVYYLGPQLDGTGQPGCGRDLLALLDASEPAPSGRATERHSEVLVRELASGPASARTLSEATGLTLRQVKYALTALRKQGAVAIQGKQGARSTMYSLAAPARSIEH